MRTSFSLVLQASLLPKKGSQRSTYPDPSFFAFWSFFILLLFGLLARVGSPPTSLVKKARTPPKSKKKIVKAKKKTGKPPKARKGGIRLWGGDVVETLQRSNSLSHSVFGTARSFVPMDEAVLGDRLPGVTQKPFLCPGSLFAVPALVAQCGATPATVAATPPCSATPFRTQISVRHLPAQGGRCDTKRFWGCGATPVLKIQEISCDTCSATRVARQGVPAIVCN